MPELPEVETMRRGIEQIVGRRVLRLRRPRTRLRPIAISPRLSDFRRRVEGARIGATGRVGKRVVVELRPGANRPGEAARGGNGRGADRIVFEPRMTGLVLLADPPDEEHVRLVFELSGRPRRRLLFWDRRGLGVVRLLSPRRFEEECGPPRIGPDALEIPETVLRQRLEAGRRAVKVALLDQRAVAGIGNLYASEILHRIGIHPETRCCELGPGDWPRLHAAMREVLIEALRHQGSTLRDGTYRTAGNRPGGYQLCHRVYQRAGERCSQCGRERIVRIVQAQRSTFFCPACQKR
jgi:formamidopyrimidine-DNA glycosylase